MKSINEGTNNDIFQLSDINDPPDQFARAKDHWFAIYTNIN